MREQLIVAVLLMIGIFIYKQKVSWWLKIPWAYFLVMTTYRAIWMGYFPAFAPAARNLLGWNATKTLLMMILFPVVIFGLTEKGKDRLLVLLKCVMFYDAFIVMTGISSGLFEARTFDAVLIACFFPFWNWRKWHGVLGLLVSAGAIAHVHGRTAMMVLGVMYSVLAIQWSYKNMERIWFWAIAGSLTLCSAKFLISYGPNAFVHDSRDEMWHHFFSWFALNVDVFWGAGLGSFEWLGPLMDPGPNQRNLGYGYYVMHNDWLQIFFEMGIIGTVLAIVGYVYTAIKLRGKELAAWLGIGAGMMFYYPTHAWVIQVLALILIAKTRLLTKDVEIPETDRDQQLAFELEA